MDRTQRRWRGIPGGTCFSTLNRVVMDRTARGELANSALIRFSTLNRVVMDRTVLSSSRHRETDKFQYPQSGRDG